MATIGIRELRDGLSRHLAAVQEGDEIVVTDHGKPIARILPYGEESPLDRLIRLGVARPPRAPRAPLPEPIKKSPEVTDLCPCTSSIWTTQRVVRGRMGFRCCRTPGAVLEANHQVGGAD